MKIKNPNLNIGEKASVFAVSEDLADYELSTQTDFNGSEKKAASHLHRLNVPFETHLVGFEARSRNGEKLNLPSDPRQQLFIRTRDGDRWSADSFLGFFLQKKGASIQSYVPADLLTSSRATVS